MNKPRNRSLLFLLLIIVLFILSRISFLDLPFYWDEAWSYATAVFDMARHKLAFISGNRNPELTRGHPLLFYFLSVIWVKVFGTNTASVHLFPLLVSVALLAAVFMVAWDLFGKATAMASIVLLPLQSVFLAQSTQLLPEVMLALWTLLTVYAYFTKKWGPFAVFSVLLVMTKETGMVLIGALFVDKLGLEKLFVDSQKRSLHSLFRELAILCIPVVAFAIFIIWQKIRSGWFLYPEHLNLTTLDPDEIINRAGIYLSKLLLQHGRNSLFLLSLTAFAFLAMKRSIGRQTAHVLLFTVMFILFYIVFSSVNFFTTRYLLSLLPVFILTCAWLIVTWLKQNLIRISAILALALIFTWYTFSGNRNEQDTSLAYRHTVLLQKQAVNFAEDMQWQQKSIYTTFLMQYYLSIPELGYLNNKAHPFMTIGNHPERAYDMYIFCSNESDPLYKSVQTRSDLFLIKRFENKTAWVEIYGTGVK